MPSKHVSRYWRFLGVLRFAAVLLPALFLLSACGGGSSGSSKGMSVISPPTSNAVPTDYELTYLVSSSSTIPAQHVDSRLINAWGLAFAPTAYAWVSDAGSNYSSLYDGNGNPPASTSGVPAYVTIPSGTSGIAGPTGIVYNSSSSGFDISSGGVSAPATFLFATLGGAIEGWNETVNANSAVVAYNSTNGASFTGLTMATVNGTSYLYAADFKNDAIDVFNSSFAPVMPGAFFDSAIPSGYAPYNIQNIPNASGTPQLYVTYAQPSATSPQHVTFGTGLGYVALFQWDGTLISTLVSQGALNAPWGLAIAPSNFGTLSGDLLVGNLGNGAINAYNPTTGASMGAMMGSNGQQLFVPGLWGLAFGNSYDSQPTNTLFFTGGPDTQTAGVFGRIDLPGSYTPPSGSGGSGGGYG